MAILARFRHLRSGHFARIRHGRRTLAFLAAQATRLTASATAITLTMATVSAVAAAQTLTNDATNVLDGDTVTIDGVVYTFQSTLTNVAGHIKIGASNTASMTNLFHGINASGGVVGTDYATLCVAHPTVTATNPSGTTVLLTAKSTGAAGNSITTTEASTHLAFGAGTLAGGVTASFGPNFTATAHGVTNGEGSYVLTAATTLPGGYTAGTRVWVNVIDANTLALATDRNHAAAGLNLLTYTNAGVGALTLTKTVTSQGIYELLRTNKAVTVAAAADIDNLN